MNELAMNLATGRVDNRYLMVLIVGKAIFVKALCEGSAMCNRVGIVLNSIPILSLNGTLSIMSKKNFCIAVNLGLCCLAANFCS